MNRIPDNEHESRAGLISDLRAFADMLANEPALSAPVTVSSSVYVPCVKGDAYVSVAEVFAAARKLGTEVVYNRREAIVETAWQRGAVTYRVYTRIPRHELAEDAITVTSVDQVLGVDHSVLTTLRLAAQSETDPTAGGVA